MNGAHWETWDMPPTHTGPQQTRPHRRWVLHYDQTPRYLVEDMGYTAPKFRKYDLWKCVPSGASNQLKWLGDFHHLTDAKEEAESLLGHGCQIALFAAPATYPALPLRAQP